MSTQNDSEPVGVTDIEPPPPIGFTPPEGCRRYCMVTIWASTPEDYERIRALALDQDSFRDSDDVTTVAQPVSVCGWLEGEVSCSLHAPPGYTRPTEHPRSDGAF